MRSLIPAAFAVRVVVWVATLVVCAGIARDDLLAYQGFVDALPFWVFVTLLPGLVYTLLVRTWVGTLVATVVFAGGWLALVAFLSAQSDESSTAGLGLLTLPVLIVIPLLVVFAVEVRTRPDDEHVRVD